MKPAIVLEAGKKESREENKPFMQASITCEDWDKEI